PGAGRDEPPARPGPVPLPRALRGGRRAGRSGAARLGVGPARSIGLGWPAPPRPGRPYLAGAPVLVAHRGGSRLAPENTMAAFEEAVELWGADMLELDARATRDGTVVVIHDATVDRTTDGQGEVAAHTLAELRALDAGYRFVDLGGRHARRGLGIRVPTMDEVLERFPDVWINVESKDPRAAVPLRETIRRHRAEHRVLFAA